MRIENSVQRTEYKELMLPTYTQDGNPVCVNPLESGCACKFFALIGGGTMCLYNASDLERMRDGTGWVVPNDECPFGRMRHES